MCFYNLYILSENQKKVTVYPVVPKLENTYSTMAFIIRRTNKVDSCPRLLQGLAFDPVSWRVKHHMESRSWQLSLLLLSWTYFYCSSALQSEETKCYQESTIYCVLIYAKTLNQNTRLGEGSQTSDQLTGSTVAYYLTFRFMDGPRGLPLEWSAPGH